MAGKVRVPGRANLKAGLEVPPETPIEIAPDACPYVSRGGLKLAAALDEFGVQAAGRTALDVGSSTGGFTDCLLQRGAGKVYAVDVGTKQLDSKLRGDPRVAVMENTHARDLKPGLFDPRPDLAVVDVSFISLTKVLPWIVPCLASPFDIVALIKPQFELEAKKTPKGVVRKEEHREEAISRVRAAAGEIGLAERGLMASPLTGAKGNREFLIHLCAA